jgi:DNA-binding PadR family transcriptional regulator
VTSRAYTNDPPLLILTSLADGEKHGYALLQDIERFAGIRLGPGTLYGAITRLEERGLIEAAGGAEPGRRRRRPYRITPAGSDALTVSLAELRAVVEEGLARLAAIRPTAAGGVA